MSINITKIIINEFEKIDFRTLDSYGTYLATQQKRAEIEDKFPNVKDDINAFNDLCVYYHALLFEEYANFVLEFIKAFRP